MILMRDTILVTPLIAGIAIMLLTGVLILKLNPQYLFNKDVQKNY
jgi:hypothetical protein